MRFLRCYRRVASYGTGSTKDSHSQSRAGMTSAGRMAAILANACALWPRDATRKHPLPRFRHTFGPLYLFGALWRHCWMCLLRPLQSYHRFTCRRNEQHASLLQVHDARFCLNGLLGPNRRPHPGLYEVKYAMQPVHVTLQSWRYERPSLAASSSSSSSSASPTEKPSAVEYKHAMETAELCAVATLRVKNLNSFVSLANIVPRITLEVDGVEVATLPSGVVRSIVGTMPMHTFLAPP